MNGDGVELQGTIAVVQQRLRVSYEIENRTGQDIYVFDAMFELKRGHPILDSALVYTVIERDMLSLFRGVLKIPDGLQVEAPDLPLARLLPSGRKLTSTIEAQLPLRFHNPYQWHEREETRSFHKVCLRVGYVLAQDIGPLPIPKTVSNSTVYSIGYRQVINVEHILETSVQDVEVNVRITP